MSGIAQAYVMTHAVCWSIVFLLLVLTCRTRPARACWKEDPGPMAGMIITAAVMAALGWCSVQFP